ncbi:hypothetical protein HYE69_06995 [Staphylococcus sp. GSSP0090]|nr:hypothetical protein [Staphylococcus sp. GSSP0090]
MNRLDGKTVITIIGVIGLMIFTFIFTVGYILSNIDPENKLEGYAIAISFIGIFATFGGAYLGAKIAGDNARKLFEMQRENEREEQREQIVTHLTLSMHYIVKLIDKISAHFIENRKIYRYLYHRKNTILNNNYTTKINREELKDLFYNLVEQECIKKIRIEDYTYNNFLYFGKLLNKLMISKEIINLKKEEQQQLFLFRQIIDNISYMFNEEKTDLNQYFIDLNDTEKELAFIEYYVQLCILLMDIQKWTLLNENYN